MSEWETLRAGHQVVMPGNSPYTSVWVSAAVDQEPGNDDRPKFRLEEQEGNMGGSLKDPDVLSRTIEQVSNGVGRKATSIDWYVMGEDKELYRVEVEEEQSIRENPQFRQLANSGDLSRDGLEKARESFPDVEVTDVSVQLFPAGDEESWKVSEAFASLDNQRPEPAHQVSQQEWMEAELPQRFQSDQDVGHDL